VLPISVLDGSTHLYSLYPTYHCAPQEGWMKIQVFWDVHTSLIAWSWRWKQYVPAKF